jgi:hypothetical protein
MLLLGMGLILSAFFGLGLFAAQRITHVPSFLQHYTDITSSPLPKGNRQPIQKHYHYFHIWEISALARISVPLL